MKTTDLKYHVLKWLFYDKNCLGAFTESKNRSDVFGINQSRFGIEVEVKTDKLDLRTELKVIYNLSNRIYQPGSTKVYKHLSYLKEEREDNIRPRYFYIAVPEEFERITKTTLMGTPYGILSVHEGAYNGQKIISVHEILTPKKLTDKKIEDSELINFITKASAENINLRERLRKNNPIDKE